QLHTLGAHATIQSKHLADFLGKAGPLAGNCSRVYYAGFVFFEKIRLALGEDKSAHRREMERLWGARGGVGRNEKLLQGLRGEEGCKRWEWPVRMDAFGRMPGEDYIRP